MLLAHADFRVNQAFVYKDTYLGLVGNSLLTFSPHYWQSQIRSVGGLQEMKEAADWLKKHEVTQVECIVPDMNGAAKVN